jgi:hypothetical protein
MMYGHILLSDLDRGLTDLDSANLHNSLHHIIDPFLMISS